MSMDRSLELAADAYDLAYRNWDKAPMGSQREHEASLAVAQAAHAVALIEYARAVHSQT